MKLIRMLKPKRIKNYVMSVGLFFCEFCKKEVVKQKGNGLSSKSCGCQMNNKTRNRGQRHYNKPTSKLVSKRKADRPCLMCGELFGSEGYHNRRCPACEAKLQAAGENTYYEPYKHRFSDNSIMRCAPEC